MSTSSYTNAEDMDFSSLPCFPSAWQQVFAAYPQISDYETRMLFDGTSGIDPSRLFRNPQTLEELIRNNIEDTVPLASAVDLDVFCPDLLDELDMLEAEQALHPVHTTSAATPSHPQPHCSFVPNQQFSSALISVQNYGPPTPPPALPHAVNGQAVINWIGRSPPTQKAAYVPGMALEHRSRHTETLPCVSASPTEGSLQSERTCGNPDMHDDGSSGSPGVVVDSERRAAPPPASQSELCAGGPVQSSITQMEAPGNIGSPGASLTWRNGFIGQMWAEDAQISTGPVVELPRPSSAPAELLDCSPEMLAEFSSMFTNEAGAGQGSYAPLSSSCPEALTGSKCLTAGQFSATASNPTAMHDDWTVAAMAGMPGPVTTAGMPVSAQNFGLPHHPPQAMQGQCEPLVQPPTITDAMLGSAAAAARAADLVLAQQMQMHIPGGTTTAGWPVIGSHNPTQRHCDNEASTHPRDGHNAPGASPQQLLSTLSMGTWQAPSSPEQPREASPSRSSCSGTSEGAVDALRSWGSVDQSAGMPLQQCPGQQEPWGAQSYEGSGKDGSRPSKGSQITIELLRTVFELPIDDAAKQLGLGATVLKKYCRKYDIPRWPFRKLKSMDRLIQGVEEHSSPGDSESKELVSQLRGFRELIMMEPSTSLEGHIKRLRQANFKMEYKLRKALVDLSKN